MGDRPSATAVPAPHPNPLAAHDHRYLLPPDTRAALSPADFLGDIRPAAGRAGVDAPTARHQGLMPALLVASALEAVADGEWLVRSLSLEVAEGTIVALVGGAGAGKSVLLDLLLGLRPLRSGSVRFGDRDITSFDTLERQRLGLRCALQQPPTFPGLTVAEQLSLTAAPMRLAGDASRRIMQYLPELEPHLGLTAIELEPQLRRLVDLGRAMLGMPRLLMIDQLLPSVGVDRAGELLQALRRDGYTLLVADRYAEGLLRHADYGYVMDRGRVVASGLPEELLADDRLLAACAGDPDAYA